MANTKVTSNVLADDAVTIGKIHTQTDSGGTFANQDPSDGHALVAKVNTNGYHLSWESVSVSGISSSADSTAITIDSSERVGVGTTSPTTPLHVESSTTNQNTAFIKNTAGTGVNYGLEIRAGTNATDHALQVLDSSGTSRLRVTGAGNVGISNASPSQKLDVNGTAIADNIYAGGSSGNKKTVVNFPCTSSYPNTSTYTFSLSATEAPIGSWVILGIRITSGNSGGDQYAYLEQNNDKGNRQMNYVDSWYYNDASASMYYISAASDRNFTLNHATIVATNTNDWREVYYWGYIMDN